MGFDRFSNKSGRSGLTEVPTQVSAEDVGKGEQFQGQEHPKQTIKPRKHLETSGNTLKTRTTQKKTHHMHITTTATYRVQHSNYSHHSNRTSLHCIILDAIISLSA